MPTDTGIFMTAEWRTLALVTFAVPDDVLAPYLPRGTEPDRWRGQALASLVVFEFEKTSVFGIPAWPYRRFPEWNLRFYLKDVTRTPARRGVSFVRELVPGFPVAAVARWIYDEPYLSLPYRLDSRPGARTHRIRYRDTDLSIAFTFSGEPAFPAEDTLAHFLKEQDWGFGKARGERRASYHVVHPRWRTYPVSSITRNVDCGLLYGPQWAFLNEEAPVSEVVAEGSEVTVYRRVLD